MSLFKSNNPTLNEKVYEGTIFEGMVLNNTNSMTIKGTLNKFGILLLLMLSTSVFSWKYAVAGNNILPFTIAAIFGGLILAFIMARNTKTSVYLAPIYALLEGLFVGGISAYFQYGRTLSGGYSGIVVQAIGLTLGVAIAMYALYHFKIIKVTQKFKSVLMIASVGIGIFYLGMFILSLFIGKSAIPGFVYQPSLLGIGFSLFVVCLASLNLLVDFDNIEKGVKMGAPKHMEWYSSFGLLVTLVWLYIEILRLLAKLSGRD
jgi:uncharacterized YccA/Bax inhibitor family protein